MDVQCTYLYPPGTALRDLARRLRDVRDALNAMENLEDSYAAREPLGHDLVIHAFGHMVGDWDKKRAKLSGHVDEVAGALEGCADAYVSTDGEIAGAIRDASG